MKKIYLALLIFSSIINASAQEKPDSNILDKAYDFSLFQNKDISIDLKVIDPAKGYFGIDYKLDLKRKLLTLSQDTFLMKNINFGLSSQGFVTVAGDKNQNNSIISELKFEGFPLFYKKPHKITAPARDWREAAIDPNLTNEARDLAKKVSSPFWFFMNIHAKHETTQDFKSYDFAFGSTASFSTSYLNAILDFPFGLLRSGKNNSPRQLDISVGYDFVTGLRNTTYASLNDSINNTNRLNIKAEWETGIFGPNDRIGFLLDTYYDINANSTMKSMSKDWNYFYMIRLDHILSESSSTRTKVSIKYTEGALPPNYIKGYIIGGGFSVEF